MVTLRVVRHDRELVLAEVPSDVIPSRGEVLQLDTLDDTGEKTRPSTLWRIVSVTVHVPSLASSVQRDGSRSRSDGSRSPCCLTSRSSPNSPRRPRRSFPSRRCDGRSVDPRDRGCVGGSRPATGRLLSMYTRTQELPAHLREWRLPPGWAWGSEGLHTQHRHYQEVVDALGRSLSLVTAPNDAHAVWLESEARHLAHRNHPAIPTTYHYWSTVRGESARAGLPAPLDRR